MTAFKTNVTTAKTMTAKLEEVLLDYEGAQIVLLISAKRLILGVAIEDFKGLETPFFCCAVKDKSFEKYINGRADLHYVFRTAFRKKYFFADLKNLNSEINLIKASNEDLLNENYWPDIGLFSRCHTSDYGIDGEISTTQTYHIDGTWGANDFATFNNKIADLYAICDVVTPVNDDNFDEQLIQSISSHNFSSGGSYLGFYNGLKKSSNQLRIKELRYASPGIIALSGNQAALEEVADVLSRFMDDYSSVQETYKKLFKILKSDNLLSAEPNERFSSEDSEELAFKYGRELYKAMGFENSDWLHKHCNKNTLIYCKIVRSIFTRASRIWDYKLEGRLQEVEFE
ncbi:MAG: hypothetical protein ABJG88_07135 [Litorimonas sp.]